MISRPAKTRRNSCRIKARWLGGSSTTADGQTFFYNLPAEEVITTPSHVALGQGFPNAIAGGDAMGARQLERLGVNRSAIHTDVMFGSTAVTIVASDSREGEVVLIDRGRWAEQSLIRRELDCTL